MNIVELEKAGLLAKVASAAASRPLTVDSALVCGAYIDNVEAGLEPPVINHAAIVQALNFFIESCTYDEDLTGKTLESLRRVSVWSIQDMLKNSAKAVDSSNISFN